MKPTEFKGLFILIGLVLGWMVINFNFELAVVYAIFLVVAYFIIDTYGKSTFPVEKDENRLIDIVFGTVGYALYLVLAFVVATITQAGASMQSAFDLINAIQPIFANSPIFSVIGWGIVVPMIETILIGLLIPLLARWLNTSMSLTNIKSHIIYAVLGFGATLFHLTTRASVVGGAIKFDQTGLILTFAFFYMTAVGIVYFEEIAPMAYTHIIANTIAVGAKFGLGYAMFVKGLLGG